MSYGDMTPTVAEGEASYDKNNKVAGMRLRNTLQQIKILATDLRKDMTGKKERR